MPSLAWRSISVSSVGTTREPARRRLRVRSGGGGIQPGHVGIDVTDPRSNYRFRNSRHERPRDEGVRSILGVPGRTVEFLRTLPDHLGVNGEERDALENPRLPFRLRRSRRKAVAERLQAVVARIVNEILPDLFQGFDAGPITRANCQSVKIHARFVPESFPVFFLCESRIDSLVHQLDNFGFGRSSHFSQKVRRYG
jgi:hypothetical protein